MIRFFALCLLFVSSAWAQPLTFITPTGPGSISDTAIRFFAPLIEREMGRPVVVVNMPGANGLIGARGFLDAPKDGNYVFLGGSPIPYLAATQMGRDFIDKFEPLHGFATTPQQIMVPASSPVHSIADLVALSRKKGSLNGASAAPSTQISMGLLDKAVGTKTTVVGYKQTTQAATETAGGFVDYTIGGRGNGATAGLVAGGQLRVIGLLRDVGVEEFSWNAIFMHPSAPDEAKKKITAVIEKVLTSPEAEKFQQGRYMLGAAGVSRQVRLEYTLISNSMGGKGAKRE